MDAAHCITSLSCIIGQVQNDWQQHWLVAGNGIESVADLKGKRLSIDKLDQHPGLNAWLFLKQNGLEDGKDVQMIMGDRRAVERVRAVMSGAFDATFMGPVDAHRARELGAHVSTWVPSR
jgi:TRAP-type uncharacterized transport system substrate-binding protein